MQLTAFVRALSPNRPLDGDDQRYVERPDNGGEQLARIAALDPDPIAVFGPSGVGKSTELIRAARRLAPMAAPVLVQLDRKLDMSRLTLDGVFDACADAIESTTWPLDLAAPEPSEGAGRPSIDRLLDLIRTRLKNDGRPVLLIDGLEKADEGAARSVLKGLLLLAPETGLVVVMPPSLVIGPASYRAVEDYRQFAIGPLPLRVAQSFFRAVLDRRLAGAAMPHEALVDRATLMSGGITRTFLSLLKSAALYAALADREETRVPVPFMSPPDALAWVLATADPDLEPCGWIDPT